MASHGSNIQMVDEKVQLGNAGSGFKLGALVISLVLLAVGVAMGFFAGGEHARAHHARFYHAYLVGFAFCLSIGGGGLFFTLMQHMVKVGWSVNVRRVPEALAASLPFLGILAIPLLIPVWGEKGGELYPWAVAHVVAEHHMAPETALSKPLDVQLADASPDAGKDIAAEHMAAQKADPSAEHMGAASEESEGELEPVGEHSKYSWNTYDELAQEKQPWLSKGFFTIRIVFYFLVWTLLAWHFVGKSRQQDTTGDPNISRKLAILAPVGIIAFALTLTFAAFDMIMSLDHHWYSTIFGVYIFAGGMIGMFATAILTYRALQSKGFVQKSVTTEHFHDLGKYLFTFVFFWGYIGFSQFMLQWYASLPEEIFWWARRGVTSADLAHNTQGYQGQYAGLSIALLFGHFIIPFAYLISRHIKRSKEALIVGACWMLVAHFVDMYWLIMPEYNNGEFILDVAVLATSLGVIGLFLFYFVHQLGRANLRPIGDPRTPESLAFVNM